jgi:Common central domain of tyrosinase/Polyphenol oxidase middle domain
MNLRLLSIAVLVLWAAGIHKAAAVSPVFLPAYPLYCAGPLTPKQSSFSTVLSPSTSTNTPFQWALFGAAAAKPGPGQCAWADRRARAGEMLSGGGNVICDYSGAMTNIPAGTFVEIGVTRDALNNCMHLTHYIGEVSPPFSAVTDLPPFTRASVASLTPQQIASLRHGVQVMMARPVSDPTSYKFQANIHGTDDNGTPLETQAWNQCQHQGFYFLSWHRMYLYFFDRILRAAAQDPTLVLPYWDWTQPDQRTLPLPFRDPADSSNPLFIPSGIATRPSGFNSGTSHLDDMSVDVSKAFENLDFETGGQLAYGFGGGASAVNQFVDNPNEKGDLENQPHDTVHTLLGGSEIIAGRMVTGLMGNIRLAAQDPIFFLHHANIDRLWNSWLAQRGGRTDPQDAAWLNTRFTFYDEAGHAVYLTGSQIVNSLDQLNYRYDSEPSQPLHIHKPPTHPGQLPGQTPHKARRNILPSFGHAQPSEVLAVNEAESADGRVKLESTLVRIKLPISESTRAHMRKFSQDASQHWILRIEDVRTAEPPGFYYAIYIDPPTGVPLDSHTPGFVGTLSFFSMRPHQMRGGSVMSNEGISTQYNISALMASLINRNPSETSVVLVPHGPVDSRGEQLPLPPAPIITAGKIQLLRQ